MHARCTQRARPSTLCTNETARSSLTCVQSIRMVATVTAAVAAAVSATAAAVSAIQATTTCSVPMVPTGSNTWLYFQDEPLACCEACRCVLRARTVRMRRGSLAGATALSSNDRLPRRPSASRCTLKFAGFAPSRAQIKAGTAADVPCVCLWSIAVRMRPRSPPGATSLPRVAHLKPTPA